MCKMFCNAVQPPPLNAQCYIGKWVMEVSGRENPAVLHIFNDGALMQTAQPARPFSTPTHLSRDTFPHRLHASATTAPVKMPQRQAIIATLST